MKQKNTAAIENLPTAAACFSLSRQSLFSLTQYTQQINKQIDKIQI